LGKIISFLGEDDLGVKQIPLFIYSLPKKLQLEFIKAFWRGDGIPCRKTLALSNTSENVINGMSLLFALNNKDFHLFKTTHKNSNWKDCYELRESLEDDRIIDHKNLEFRKKYKNLIKDMQEYEGVAPDELFLLLNADVGFARIRKINIYNYNGHVYDLSVKNNENFLGGTGLLFFHNSLFIDFNIHTGIPKYLRKIKVIGSGGKYLTKTYDKYKKLAVKFAMAMLDVWETGDKNGVPFVFPKCQLHINEETFTDKDQLALLKRATEVASKNGGVYFVFDREEVTLSQCCRLSTTITDKSMLEHPESQRFCGFQNITINLPQVAYRVGKGNIEEAIKDIKNLMDLAVKAHLQKKRFIARLMNKPNLPLWEIGKEAKDGNPYVDLEKATYIIGVIGLNECLQYLTGKELHEDEEVFKIGIKIITAMNMYCKELTKTQKLLFKLEESPAESASRRFVMIDLASYPKESKSVIRGDLSKDEAYYTNSIHLRADAPVDIITRIEKQSKFHTLIESGAIIHAFVGEKLPPAESILNLITKTWKNTACSQLTISPEFTICNDCKKLTMGIKDKCSICNSTNVEGMTRIVGYYSRVKNWNKSKLGELKDRQKGDYGV
jgi:ribonucleoside-triphosphate reductase